MPTLSLLIDLRKSIMSNAYEDSLSLDALNDRIAILEDNILSLIHI